MAPMHSLCQDDQKGMKHDIFGHTMHLALALASQYANGIEMQL